MCTWEKTTQNLFLGMRNTFMNVHNWGMEGNFTFLGFFGGKSLLLSYADFFGETICGHDTT